MGNLVGKIESKVNLLYYDLQSPDFPAEINDFFKKYVDDIDWIIDLLRKEDDNWDRAANSKLCDIANEYGKLNNDMMVIIGKRINEIAYGSF